MQHRIALLLFLMSGSLTAMNKGVWDERGNYLGPAETIQQPYVSDYNQINQQVMMVPQLVYMPMYVGPHGPQPLPPESAAHYMPAFNGMLPFPPFNMFNQMQQFPSRPMPSQNIAARSDQWAAQAPLQEPAPQLQSTPQEEPELQEQSSARVESVSPAHKNEDAQVQVITEGIQDLAVSDEKAIVQPVSSTHWADVEDSPSSSSFQSSVHDDEDSSHLQSSSSSSSTSDTVLAKKPISYLEAAVQKKDERSAQKTSIDAGSVVTNSDVLSNKSKQSLDEKIRVALFSVRDAKATNRLRDLTQNKFDWIDRNKEPYRLKEWDKLARLYEQSSEFARVATQPEHATTLIQLAQTLVHNAEKMDQRLAARKTFARLALRCVESAREQLPVKSVQHAAFISDQAKGLLPKKAVVDQSAVSEEQFYKGHTAAVVQSQIRSDGKVLGGVVLSKVVPEQAVQNAKTQEVKKNLIPQQKIARKANKAVQNSVVREPALEQKESSAAKKSEQVLISDRIHKLLKGDKADIRKGFSLLEQVAEGTISDADSDLQIEAMRALGSYYFHGYSDANSQVIKPNPKRATYFLNKAVHAGDVQALADILPLVFEHDREKVGEYVDQLEVHPNAEEMLKQTGRLYRAAARFMDDEQGQLTQALAVFKQFNQVYQDVSFDQPMTAAADVLPYSFYTWVRERIPHWQQALQESQNANQKGTQADPRLEWLYIMGRFHLEGTSKRFGKFHYDALEWIKTAADLEHLQAQLYLATPRSNPEAQLSIFDSIRYLRLSLDNSEKRTPAENTHSIALSELYADQGFLYPVADYLCVNHVCKTLDSALSRLESQLGTVRISGVDRGLYRFAQDNGLIDELEKRAADNWVARTVLSALEISRCRAYEEDFQASSDMIVQIDKALERIKGDVETHSAAQAVTAACYASRALVNQLLASHATYATLGAGTQLMKQVASDYEQSVKMGDRFGKYSCAAVQLFTNAQFPGARAVQQKGVATLQELAEAEDEEFKLSALEALARHFRHEDPKKSAQYLKQARKWAAGIHRDLQPETLGIVSEKLKKNRVGAIEALKVREYQLAEKQKRDREVASTMLRMQKAETCLLSAVKDARTNPFKALSSLKEMQGCNVQRMLPNNPRMIASGYMALDDIRAAASDEHIVGSPVVKERLFVSLEPLYRSMGLASLQYKAASSKPGYTLGTFESLVQAYLNAYHFKVRFMHIMETTLPKSIPAALRELLRNMPGSDLLTDQIDLIPEDTIAADAERVINNALQKARTEYQTTADARSDDLHKALINK